MIPPLTVIDVKQEIEEVKRYRNVPISLINDHIMETIKS
jgi:hypothetical protein